MNCTAVWAEWWFEHFIGIGELPFAETWVCWVDVPPEGARFVFSTTRGGVVHGIAGGAK